MRFLFDGSVEKHAKQGVPPFEEMCFMLCGEFGCPPFWYLGYAWQSRNLDGTSVEGQPVQYYRVVCKDHQPFHCLEYLNKYIMLEDVGYTVKDGEIIKKEE